MAFNINDLTQYFDNPAVSKFNRSKKVSFDTRIGRMLPANWEFLNFGNSIKGTSFHSLRLAPLLAPNFSDLQIQEHTAAVPLRVIMQNYEETFNYATNKDGAILPSFDAEQYHFLLRRMCTNGINPIGSLFDFLGYPVYADLFECLQTLSMSSNSDFNFYNVNFAYSDYNSWYHEEELDISISFDYRQNTYEAQYLPKSADRPFLLVEFVAHQLFPDYPIENAVYSLFQTATKKGLISSFDMSLMSMSVLLELSRYETVVSLMDAYNAYLFGFMLETYLYHIETTNLNVRYTTLPLRAYWRFHADWNTNGNFFDRDFFINENVFNFESTIMSLADSDELDDITKFRNLVMPANRLWINDFWTSQLPTSSVDNAIEIPANSTILNLASLTAFQKLVLKLSYSSRYRDVVWNIFKIAPSDARLQQSSVISRRYHSVGIGETIQTSESTTSSVLGNFAGRGYSSGKSDYYHILAEEPIIILNLFSLIPFASYADALHPNIHLDDIFDVPIPDMDVLGNQPIYTDLISGNLSDSDSVFGFGRQYQEFLANYDTVHGQLKTSLSYWQLSRRFATEPRLNDNFLRISDSDDFDNLFSVPDSSHAFATVLYKYDVTRHVHRNVRILI